MMCNLFLVIALICTFAAAQPGCPAYSDGSATPLELRGSGVIAPEALHPRWVGATFSINSGGVDFFDRYSTALVR